MASSFSVDDVLVDESQEFVDFVVRLDTPSADTVSVSYVTNGSTAQANVDFAYRAATLTLLPGETRGVVRVPLLADTRLEASETFSLSLFEPVNAGLLRPVARATIVDNDAAPGAPRVTISDLVLDESAREARFIVTLDRPSEGAQTGLWVAVGGSAQAGQDFVPAGGSLTFLPGQTAQTVIVPLIDDPLAETHEYFSVALSGFAGAVAIDNQARAVLLANDAPAVARPSIVIDDVLVDETQTIAQFVVRLDAPGRTPVTVRYATGNESARYDEDFVYQEGLITFAPGETSRTIAIDLLDDVRVERAEEFNLFLFSPVDATLGDALARATIVDNDDTPGVPVISVISRVFDEQEREAVFAVLLDRPAAADVTAEFSIRSGIATAGADFSPVLGSLRFAPGQMVQTIAVPLIDDGQAEPDEDLSVVLTGIVGADRSSLSGRTWIHANDTLVASLPVVSIDAVAVDESRPFVDLMVHLDSASAQPVTVRYGTSDNTARYDEDYLYTEGQLIFAPGETVKTVRVGLPGDAVVERTESLAVVLSSPVNATIGQAAGWITLIDNDAPAGPPVVSVSSPIVDESESEARFVISLDRPALGVVRLDYRSVDGQANAGRDFEFSSGSLQFAPGQTAATVSVRLIDDGRAEADERFGLAIVRLEGASAIDPLGLARIGANDAPVAALPTVNFRDTASEESTRLAVFEANLDAPSAVPVSVGWATGDLSAVYNSDFDYTGGIIRFEPGETTKTIRVTLLDDTIPEGREELQLYLGSADGLRLGRSPVAAVLDDDGNTVLQGSVAFDEYLVRDSTTRIIEPLDAAADLVRSEVSLALADNLERLELLGAAPLDGRGNAADNTLTGNAGDNSLAGLGGNDVIDGAAGFDTAVFAGPRSGYRIAKEGAQWRVGATAGNEGIDLLTSIESVAFADTVLSLLAPQRENAPVYGRDQTFLFDPVYYLLANSGLAASVPLDAASSHYLQTGAAQGASPNAWFDPIYYANRWPDLTPLNLDAATLFQHYNLFGVWEGRSAGPLIDRFDGNRYLQQNADVAAYVDAFIGDFLGSRTNGAIAHYMIYGAAEGRAAFDAGGVPISLDYLL